jgi:hypothetical protein
MAGLAGLQVLADGFEMIQMRTVKTLITATVLGVLASCYGSTLALWDFNDPALGAANGAALPDSDAQTVWRQAAADKSGNGNHLTTWQYDWGGFVWVNNSPLGDFSIKAAGSYPAAYTWSASNAPTGVDIESAVLNQFTIEGVFTATGSGNRTLVGRDGRYLSAGTPANAALYFQVDGGDHPVLEFTDVNSNRVRLVASATTIVDDNTTWYHLAGVSDGSTVSLYLNHELIAQTNVAMGALAKGTASGSDWHAGGWSLARGLYNGGHVDRWLGNIDAVAISDTALSTNTFVLPVPAFTNTVPKLANVTNETVYLFCYHVGGWPNGGTSGVFINWSVDGYNYYPLNNGHPVFVCPEFPEDDADSPGSPNMTRDPSIIYDATNGLYRMVWTSALWTRSFGYAESPDLKHWTNVKLVQMWPNPADTIGQTWAPEWFYLEETGEYMIIFSSAVNSASIRLYYTKTSDFVNFSAPVELYHDVAQSSVIDGFMAKVAADHYIMATAQQGTIWIVDGPTPYGPWSERTSSAMPTPREGPALIKINGVWHLYADYYTGVSDNVFRLATSTDTTNWTDQSILTLLPRNSDVPDFDGPPHHGTIFAAPRSTLGAFLNDPKDAITNLSSLVYRWSFNGTAGSAPAGTTITDSVSSAVAIVRGTNAQFTGTGLRLPGTSTGNAAADTMAAYLDLPNGIISALTNLTVEIWATPVSSKNWQRLFDFGRTAEAGNGVAGEWTGESGSAAPGSTSGSDDLFLSLNRGTDLNLQRCYMSLDGASQSSTDIALDSSAGTQYHYVVTFEDGVGYFGSSGGRLTLYRNGVRIADRDVSFHLRQMEDVNNWLGRSQWSGDSNSNVEYNEVRIYSEALTWAEIYGHFLAGPDVPVNDHPALKISAAENATVVNWPGNAAGYSLRQADDLTAPAPWALVTNVLKSTTNGLEISVSPESGKKFFRLEK